jgi:hypothetical protein
MDVEDEDRREAPSPLLEAAGFILESAGGTLLTTQLIKALFYLDCEAILELGAPFTGAIHVALQHGPIVESYNETLLRPLELARIAVQDNEAGMGKPVALTHAVKRKHLTPKQAELARARGFKAKEKNSTEWTSYAHENPGWIAAWRDGDGQGSPINMRIAVQQLLDDDPWMSAPLTETEKKVFEEPDPSDLVPWE